MKTFLVELEGGTRLIITADTYFESTIGDSSEYVFVLRSPDGTTTLRTFKAGQVTRIEPARKAPISITRAA